MRVARELLAAIIGGGRIPTPPRVRTSRVYSPNGTKECVRRARRRDHARRVAVSAANEERGAQFRAQKAEREEARRRAEAPRFPIPTSFDPIPVPSKNPGIYQER